MYYTTYVVPKLRLSVKLKNFIDKRYRRNVFTHGKREDLKPLYIYVFDEVTFIILLTVLIKNYDTTCQSVFFTRSYYFDY